MTWAASAPGISKETDATYWVWLPGAGPTAKTVAEGTRVFPMVPPMVDPWPTWGTATTWTTSPATRATEGIWSPFNKTPTTCSPEASCGVAASICLTSTWPG